MHLSCTHAQVIGDRIAKDINADIHDGSSDNKKK